MTHFEDALQKVLAGDLVAIPTETVYGLAAPINNPTSIEKIFAIKERPFFDPLIVHIADDKQVLSVAREFPPLAKNLVARFWPGPLTIVLPKNLNLNPMITSGLDTVGIRMPDHPLTLSLIRAVGHPLAAPSANKFSQVSPTRPEHVRAEFGGLVYTLDGGQSNIGVESTVIGFSNSYQKIHVYRPGIITVEQLEEFAEVEVVESPAAPGHLKHHYQPKKPLFLLDERGLSIESYRRICAHLHQESIHPAWLRLPDDPVLAARLLYQNMRDAGENPFCDCILLAYNLSRKDGIWAAITDRLTKASVVF